MKLKMRWATVGRLLLNEPEITFFGFAGQKANNHLVCKLLQI